MARLLDGRKGERELQEEISLRPKYLREYVGLPITDVCRSMKDTNVPAVAYELRAVHELTKEAKNIIDG